MRTYAQQTGAAQALRVYGLEKQAGVVMDTLKRIAVGHPQQALKQLRKGTLYSAGGLGRDAFVPDGPLSAALMYGFPAWHLYNDLKEPAESRGSAVGGTIGGFIGGGLGQPLGLLGTLAGNTLLTPLGRAIGSSFDSAPRRAVDQPPEVR